MKILLAIPLLLITTGLYSQECPKCDTGILIRISHTMDELNYDDVKKFACTFDPKCKNNVEFAEWSNDLLFKVMENDINILNLAIHDLGYDQLLVICDEIANPIKDYNLAVIYQKVKNSDSPKDMIMEQTRALEEAAEKDGIYLKNNAR